MRDVLIHQYFAVDLEVVWDTVHNRFPTIKSHLRRILSDLDADE
nr:HepT-like ribonuclease domain-containing protein [Salinibacter sp.]